MSEVEQSHIAAVAKRYGVAPHQLMDVLGIRYKGGQYQVNGQDYSTYHEAIIGAESQREEFRGRGASSQAVGSQGADSGGGVSETGLRVIHNVHFLMSVFYAHFALALSVFLASVRPVNVPMKLVGIEVVLLLLLSLHVSAIFLWQRACRSAAVISVLAGLFLLLGFPVGTVLGLALIYYSLKVSSAECATS